MCVYVLYVPLRIHIKYGHFLFYCSYDKGAAFFGQVGHKWQIAGVDKGILGMCVNERRRITVPPHLTYSSQAAGNTSKHTFYIDKMY